MDVGGFGLLSEIQVVIDMTWQRRLRVLAHGHRWENPEFS
jgi:hypothetical protein